MNPTYMAELLMETEDTRFGAVMIEQLSMSEVRKIVNVIEDRAFLAKLKDCLIDREDLLEARRIRLGLTVMDYRIDEVIEMIEKRIEALKPDVLGNAGNISK